MNSKPPKYCHHKATDRACVYIHGQPVYLGRYNSPESHERYRQVVDEYLRTGNGPPPRAERLTVAMLVARYLAYLENSHPKKRKSNIYLRALAATKVLVKTHASTPADEFGPKALKQCIQHLANESYSITTIQQSVGGIKRLFRWAVSEELLRVEVSQAIDCVEAPRAGSLDARPARKVYPAPEESVTAVLPLLTGPIRAMVELMLLTGARPAELTGLRVGQIQREGKLAIGYKPIDLGQVWAVDLVEHKNATKGLSRCLLFGPKAQEVIGPFLENKCPTDYVFNPADGWTDFKKRSTILTKIRVPKRIRERYDPETIRKGVQRACDTLGIPLWFPYQLRHNAATRLVAEFGWDTARIVLGHSSVDMTRDYAEDDLRKAIEAMRQAG